MEHTTPSSGPEKGKNYFKQQSPDIGPDNDNVEIEFITIHNTTKMWEGPRYPVITARQRGSRHTPGGHTE